MNKSYTVASAHLFFGSIAILLVSVIYILTPVEAALPAHSFGLTEAIRATRENTSLMRMAGTLGILGDLGFAVGCMGMGLLTNDVYCRLGWTWGFAANLIFLFVDLIFGFVLAATARDTNAQAAYMGFRELFSFLFAAGIFAMGVAMLLIFGGASVRLNSNLQKWFCRLSKLVGTLSLLTSFAFILHLETGMLMGGLVVPMCMSFIYLSYHLRVGLHESSD